MTKRLSTRKLGRMSAKKKPTAIDLADPHRNRYPKNRRRPTTAFTLSPVCNAALDEMAGKGGRSAFVEEYVLSEYERRHGKRALAALRKKTEPENGNGG